MRSGWDNINGIPVIDEHSVDQFSISYAVR